jgi:osmoprotectant transport system permease protein
MDVVTQAVAWLTDPANWEGPGSIPIRLAEHLAISGVSLLIATVLALPLGTWIGHTGRGATVAVNVANIGRALPSLAVIGIVLPITAAIDPQLGFKVLPTLVAMVVLAVPPILVNAYAGIAGVDRDLTDAARGMGLRERDVLGRVELPIAMPVVVGGLRSATVQVIATATLGAVFGFGGLGRYLVEGVAQQDEGMLFGGVVLVAGLAIAAELVLAGVQRGLTSPGIRRERERRTAPATSAAP